ncbi:MAG: AAA family ATPase [Coriobacteriales bacterium]|nr:AAA family ATPase [Coriobacteriales bacterium]
MLTKFSVSNYHGFGEPIVLDLGHPREYSFNPGYINNGVITNALVIGPNASGKTNLLKAIRDVRANYYAADDSLTLGSDESYLNANSQANEADFEYEFLFDGVRVLYTYAKDRERKIVREKLAIDGSTVFSFGAEGTLLENNLALIGAQSLNWEYSGSYASALAYISSNAPVRQNCVLHKLRTFTQSISLIENDGWGSSKNLPTILSTIISKNLVSELEQFLRGFGIDEKLVVLRDADGSKAVYSKHARPVPFADCSSSGTRALVSVFYIYHAIDSGSLCLFDDFDAHCHFEVAEKLIRYLGDDSGRQTISTTHNTSLARNDVMRPDCIFKFGQDRSLRALSERTSRELRFGNNVERLLRNGEFD